MLLNDTLVTIVGVAPAQMNALLFYSPVGLWTPVSASRALAMSRGWGMTVVARMRPGVTDADAQRELQDLDDRARSDAGLPARTASSNVVRLSRATDFLSRELHAGLWIVFGATSLVLLIACANVANLQLVRTTRRAGELAVRRALGASSARLARQFIIEGSVLTLLGAAVGVLFGYWILWAVVAMRPEQLRQLTVVRFDWAAVGFAVGAAVISSVVFAVAPAWRQGTAALADGLRLSGAHGSPRRRWLQPAVVSGEIALSLVLLTGAGLLARSFVRIQRADPGYVADGLIEFGVTLQGAHFPDSLARDAFWHQFLPRVKEIPGVAAASIPANLPTDPFALGVDSLQVEGRPFAPGEGHLWLEYWRYSGADFRILQNRLVKGRLFTTEDERGETDAIVVGERTARYLWPGESAIGKRLRHPFSNNWLTVIGVVADQGAITGAEFHATGFQVFVPTSETRLHQRRGLLVRVAGGANTETVLANMTSALHAMDRTIPVTLAKSETTIIHDAQAQPRFVTMILAIFAGLALLLAGRRTLRRYLIRRESGACGEIGVRMALGAESTDIVRLVLRATARGWR